jgi:hypothetical protein
MNLRLMENPFHVQNITHHVQNYHHNATKKSSPTSSNSSGNSNPSSSIRSSRENSDASTTKKEVTVCLPNEPVNILTLQTWSLGKLGKYNKAVLMPKFLQFFDRDCFYIQHFNRGICPTAQG